MKTEQEIRQMIDYYENRLSKGIAFDFEKMSLEWKSKIDALRWVLE